MHPVNPALQWNVNLSFVFSSMCTHPSYINKSANSLSRELWTEPYLGGYEEREAIRKRDLVTLSVVRISWSNFSLCQRCGNRHFSISNRYDLVEQTSTGYPRHFWRLKAPQGIHTFFKPHEPTRLPEIGGEPLGCFGSFVVGRTRPLPDGDGERGAFRRKRDLQRVHSWRTYNCKQQQQQGQIRCTVRSSGTWR